VTVQALASALALLLAAQQGPKISTEGADAGPSTRAVAPSATASDGGVSSVPELTSPVDEERIRREVEARMEEAKKELRDELRAQLATQSAAQGWQEEWTEEKRKLELFVLDGFFRVRPELFNKLDLGRVPDSYGYTLFPVQRNERTLDGVNTRLQLDPTLNVSEEVRVKAQIRALDNVVWGSTPDYAYAVSDRVNLGVLSMGQVPPVQGLNAAVNSINVTRVWGEVATPVGILRFGRMPVQWGLGMYHNDGNCLDCDFGETQDRAQFVVEPLPGYYVIPSFDMNATGITGSIPYQNQGPFYNLARADDAYSFNLVLARKDTDAQARARLENNLSVFNYGVYFTFREQMYESTPQGETYKTVNAFIPVPDQTNRKYRTSQVYMPNIWLKYEQKRYRLEIEGMGIFGTAQVDYTPLGQSYQVPYALTLTQWGFAAQTEYRFLDGALKVGFDFGSASGERTNGLGNHPGRTPLPGSRRANNPGAYPTGTIPGDIDGPTYCIPNPAYAACTYNSSSVRNFQFSPDYHIDEILWRELLGGVTDAYYVRPNISYTIIEGLSAYLAGIYSGTLYPSASPSATSRNLGIELNLGVQYQTDDGFFANLRYAVLFPLEGLNNSTNPLQPPSVTAAGTVVSLDTAQAVRANIGIKF
jgi:uncharacterized protein (TIGR04551 family)